ncbi:MAG TPA: ferritin [Candidatus Binatia bacterium]|nr:ferritin [Candidatus Binatia bacterium]
MANSVGLHESEAKLSAETTDRHRALTSMQEELEAVDWYDQRVDAANDPELREILAHNSGEEKEHFVMVLEWLRRRDAKLSAELQNRLFTTGSITAQEEAEKDEGGQVPATGARSIGDAAGGGAGAAHPGGSDGSLGIGSLKGGSSL